MTDTPHSGATTTTNPPTTAEPNHRRRAPAARTTRGFGAGLVAGVAATTAIAVTAALVIAAVRYEPVSPDMVLTIEPLTTTTTTEPASPPSGGAGAVSGSDGGVSGGADGTQTLRVVYYGNGDMVGNDYVFAEDEKTRLRAIYQSPNGRLSRIRPLPGDYSGRFVLAVGTISAQTHPLLVGTATIYDPADRFGLSACVDAPAAGTACPDGSYSGNGNFWSSAGNHKYTRPVSIARPGDTTEFLALDNWTAATTERATIRVSVAWNPAVG